MIISEKVKRPMNQEKVNFIIKGDGMIFCVSPGSFCRNDDVTEDGGIDVPKFSF